MPNTISIGQDGGVAILTLNRPEHMNAFTTEMAQELESAFLDFSKDDSVRAVVLTGAGKAFCAGMDLSVDGNVFGLDETMDPRLADVQNGFDDPAIINGVRDTGGRVSLAIYQCPKPVIAAINGAAVGIGATMTLPADFRIASEKARIGFVFSKIGVAPEACSTWFLPRIVGMEQALEWYYTGDIMDAETARKAGLVRDVTAPDDLLPRALELAHRVSDGKSALSHALIRQMVYRNSAKPSPLDAHLVDSLAMFHTSVGDGKEGVRAFLEKRAPEFTSKVSDAEDWWPWGPDKPAPA